MNKVNYKKTIAVIFAIVLIITMSFNTKGTYAVSKTRTELQNIVTSTAISYLNNKTYSDYGQTAMDLGKQENDSFKSTYLWRQLTQEPEMINRCNYYHIDCSSFAAIVYMYSLGYDFSEYYAQMGVDYINNFKLYDLKTSESYYKNGYKYYGKGASTAFYTKLATNQIKTVNAGTEYKPTGKNIVVYHYVPTNKETVTEKVKIRNNLINILQPGDIVVYRTATLVNGKIDGYKGHAMVYVGNKIDETNTGLIHSTGYDYLPDKNPVSIGADSYSVRYDEKERLLIKLFIEDYEKDKKSVAFTVLRPINRFCSGDACEITTLNKNALARNELAKLKIEQYAETDLTKKYKNGFTSINKYTKMRKSLSKYNSVNQGDTIDYRLYLQNNTQISFCGNGGGAYSTETGCTTNKYTWKTSSYTPKEFQGLTLKGEIPSGTEFVSCSNECDYDKTLGTVTWKNVSIAASKYATYRYTVKVIENKNITNEGMEIKTSSNNTLQLGKQITKVNPTLNEINANILTQNVKKFKELAGTKENKIKYSSTSIAENNLKNLDSISSPIEITHIGFIKSIYYNTLGINLNYLSTTNIKNAIFDRYEKSGIKSNDYAKKTTEEVNALTNTDYKNINKMLVKGMYGGQYLRGNDNKDRANYIRLNYSELESGTNLFQKHDLEVGDIVVGFFTKSGVVAGSASVSIYLGMDSTEKYPVFAKFLESDGVVLYNSFSTTTGYTMFKEIYSKDLFVVLRPSQLYGTTVKLNYNGGNTLSDLNDLYVAYDTYKNLKDPSKSAYTTTFNYNKKGTGAASLTSTNTFNGWYYGTTKVTGASKLATTGTHELTAKWTTSSIKLPAPTVSGYTLEGWYSDSTLKTKVGAPGGTYTPTKSSTLYANWKTVNYSITYNLGGGTVTGNPVSYNVESAGITLKTPTKIGYTFNGWTGSNGTIASKTISIPKGSTGNKTYTANWTIKSITATFNANGGGASTTITKNYGTAIGTLPALTRTGYTFNGWYTAANGGTKISASTTMPASNVTYYASWTPNTYEITLNSEEANTPGTTKVYYQYETTKTINNIKCYYYKDKELTTCLKNGYTIESPIKTGSKFGGYYTGTNGTGTNYINSNGTFLNNIYKTTGNKTLYAKYITNALTATEDIIIKQSDVYVNEKNNESNTFISKLNIENKDNYRIEIHDENNQIINKLYTGSKTKVFLNNEKVYEYKNIVIGDVNKTGTVTMADVMKIASYLLDNNTMPESYNQKAGDIDKNGVVKMNDLMAIVNHIMG